MTFNTDRTADRCQRAQRISHEYVLKKHFFVLWAYTIGLHSKSVWQKRIKTNLQYKLLLHASIYWPNKYNAERENRSIAGNEWNCVDCKVIKKKETRKRLRIGQSMTHTNTQHIRGQKPVFVQNGNELRLVFLSLSSSPLAGSSSFFYCAHFSTFIAARANQSSSSLKGSIDLSMQKRQMLSVSC